MPEKINLEKRKSPEPEIDPEIERRLRTIAQRVGGDFGMEIDIIPHGERSPGDPQEGSYFNSKEVKIVFDPEDVERDPQEAEFVAAHEGGHRAITRGPESIGLKREKIDEIFKQPSFSYILNVFEDPANNNWIAKKFPGLKENIQNVYDKMLEKENIPLGLDHPGAAQVAARLGRIPKFVSYGSEIIRYWHQKRFSQELDTKVSELLNSTKKEADNFFKSIPGSKLIEKEIIKKAKDRFLIAYEEIWPQVKELVENDINDEKQHQMLKDLLENKDKDNPLNDLSRKLKKELEEQLKQTQKSEDKEQSPVSMDEFSDEFKKELEKIFNSLSKSQQKEFEKIAREEIEKLEDELSGYLQGRLNQDNSESHKERMVRIEKEKESKGKEKSEKNEFNKAREEFERKLEAEMSEYDKTRREMQPLIDNLYRQLLKIFIPERHPRWKSGYPSGGKLDLNKAMQYEADRSKYTDLWQRKTIPQKMDYRFSLLVDLSSSMRGENIEQTFKGLILLTEVLNRLGLEHEIIGFTDTFNDNIKVYKEFKDKLDDQIRDNISFMKKEDMGCTPTSSATRFTSERLEKNKGKHNFLITLTDGEPGSWYGNEEEETKNIIKEIRKKTNQKLIGLGLGSDTEHVEDYYPGSISNILAKDLPRELAQLFEEIIKNPNKY